MKRALILGLCLVPLCSLAAPAVTKPTGLAAEEQRRTVELRNRLCADRDLSCAYVDSLLVTRAW